VTIFAVIKPDLPQAADAALFAFGDGAAGGFALRQAGTNTNSYALSWHRASDQALQGDGVRPLRPRAS